MSPSHEASRGAAFSRHRAAGETEEGVEVGRGGLQRGIKRTEGGCGSSCLQAGGGRRGRGLRS